MLRLITLLFAALLSTAASAAEGEVFRFDHAVSTEGTSARFPVDQPLQPVSLPDDWSKSRPGHAGPVWYRVSFDAPGLRERGELMALFIERVCGSFEVFLNGHLVQRDGKPGDPMSRNCQNPQLVTLPAALIERQGNTIDLKVVGRPLEQVASHQRAGGLSALELGPQASLAPRHARYTALRVTVPQVVSATLLLLGSVLFVMGSLHPQDRFLAYFGGLSTAWALLTARLWLRTLPLPGLWNEVVVVALTAVAVLCAVQFLLRFAGRRLHALTVALWLQCVLMPAAVLLFGQEHVFQVGSAVYSLLAAETVAAVLLYLRLTRRERQREFAARTALLMGLMLLVGLELAVQQGAMGRWLGDAAHIAIPCVLIAIGLRLVQHHARRLHSAEENRGSVEARIREATAELERNFAQLAELRIEQITERERKRIAADLHDDLGAKLLTIVHTSESERISTLAREALEEMRLSVRGLTGRPVLLVDALGDWRAEVVSRLAQAGIEAEWKAPEEVPQTLSARHYVQTTRILRESVSNIIKHSGASHCTVACEVGDGDFQLVIQDNGRGIPMELDGKLDRGHGMSSMKHRAKQLQGQCLVESGPGFGTVIRLTLPL
jgi:signal transduction histidine kinase